MFVDDRDRERVYKILAFILAILIMLGINDIIRGCIVMDKLDKIGNPVTPLNETGHRE
jgi:hypothetical protein